MNKQFINDLVEKEQIDSPFLVQEKQLNLDKNGNPYLILNLKDKSGLIDARIWDNAEDKNILFESGDIVIIKGFVHVYQNKKQLVIKNIKKAESNEYDIDDFIANDSLKAKQIYEEILDIIQIIENPFLKNLSLSIFNDEEIKLKLLRAPAGKSIHHSWQGGLLEHIFSILKTVIFLAKNYPFLNKDLLIFGAIFHDIGKIWEITIENGIKYTCKGRLIGHIVLASDLIEKKSQEILGFPEELKDLCKHLVLSHHGKLEFGSPKVPMIIESFVLYMIDELDSKVDTMKEFIKNSNNQEKWSRYHPMFDCYFYLNNFKNSTKRELKQELKQEIKEETLPDLQNENKIEKN